MSQWNPKSSNGFTLVELLIVIAILAILATVGIVYYVGIQAKARDSARKSDLYEISTALEVNKTLSGYVPLQSSQFTSFQWSDPKGNAYCIAEGNPADPLVSGPWEDTCPAGFVSVAPGSPAASFFQWKLCTYLEKPVPPDPNVFCRQNRQ